MRQFATEVIVKDKVVGKATMFEEEVSRQSVGAATLVLTGPGAQSVSQAYGISPHAQMRIQTKAHCLIFFSGSIQSRGHINPFSVMLKSAHDRKQSPPSFRKCVCVTVKLCGRLSPAVFARTVHIIVTHTNLNPV